MHRLCVFAFLSSFSHSDAHVALPTAGVLSSHVVNNGKKTPISGEVSKNPGSAQSKAKPKTWLHLFRHHEDHSEVNRSKTIQQANSTRSGLRRLEGEYSIKGADTTSGYQDLTFDEYIYVSSFGVGTTTTPDGDNSLFYISVDDDGKVQLESKGFPGEYLNVQLTDEDCMFMCSYEVYTCSTGGFLSSCNKNWKIFTPVPREDGPLADVTLPEGTVMMYHNYEEQYLKHDGYGSSTATGMWMFDPKIPDSAIIGTKAFG